ncbi:MAG: glycosyl hydrolase [Capsulimonas sp.]|uniref:glycosyl hydrolase n=1 Tax=Capsulimonas sp. TaxID=2494211 RepID=UPI003267B50F
MSRLIFGVTLLSLSMSATAAPADSLRSGFLNPPNSAKPQTWWHWMNGNISKVGITADLESMHRVGISEANIITIGFNLTPAGQVPVMSPQFLDMVEFAAQEADRLGMTLCINNCAGWSSSGGPWVTPEHAMQAVTTSEETVQGPVQFSGKLKQPTAFPAGDAPFYGVPQPPTTDQSYRDVAVLAFKAPENAMMVTNHFYTKAAFQDFPELDPLEVEKDGQVAADPSRVVHKGSIVNLTASMKPDGSLTWSVPEGRWTILRVGYMPNGVVNKAGPLEATGPECDKLSPMGIDASWNGMMQPIIDRLGPLAGKVLVNCLIDSWEVRDQNWTPRMIEDFKRLRGYDPTPYLPVMTGRVVDSPAVSERFLWDVRRTVSDLFAQNYYKHFTELCHKHGLKSMVQSYNGPYESLQCGAASDIPMGEFWAGGNGIDNSVKMASSIGHIYGQPIVAAESFTGGDEYGRWLDTPYSLKSVGDLAFCHGINRIVFHEFAHQPWLNRKPGMTMGPYGINLERSNTWFDMSKAWMQHLTRSQFLLQQGTPAADAAYFCGQSAPVVTRAGTPALPAGYDYDDINADVLLTRARVVNHRIVLASGASYAVLVLPTNDINMTPQLLQSIQKLVRAGATVVGPRPLHSPSLADFPNCDMKVKQLADELWGKCDGTSVFENSYGKGRIIWGKSLSDVFAAQQLKQDFEFARSEAATKLTYFHRVADKTDVYFVSNQRQQFDAVECTFRVTGKIPELWHPDTGVIEPAPLWSEQDGRTKVRLSFDPSGSTFVIFRRASAPADHVIAASSTIASESMATPNWETSVTENGSSIVKAWQNGQVKLRMASGQALQASASNLPEPQEIAGAWSLSFPPNWGAPPSVTLDKLISWPDHTNNGVRYFSGTATYEKEIEISAERLSAGRELWLDLGAVKNFAEVSMNGHDLGVIWKPPFRVNITNAAKPGTNRLIVKVTNLWPNRLIGDEQLPPDAEWSNGALKAWPQWLLDGKPSPTGRLTFTTWHYWTKDSKLLESGLLGPVTLRTAEIIPTK